MSLIRMNILIEGKSYDLVCPVVDLNGKSRNYIPLLVALLESITDKQLERISIETNPGVKFLFYMDVVNCYEYIPRNAGLDCAMDDTYCICGVKIENDYYIYNTETKEEFIIGSTCIDNWLKSPKNKINFVIDKLKRLKITNPTVCVFCGKNTTNNRCLKCTKKVSLKKIFKSWKSLSQDKIPFNKYKHLQYSYYRFCWKSKTVKPYCDYVRYLLSDDCNTSPINKEKITFLLSE